MPTLEQILLSVILNVIAITTAILLRSAPPRFVLYVCLVGMSAIFIPWAFLGAQVEGYIPSVNIIESTVSIVPSPSSGYFEVENSSIYSNIIAIWFAVGFTWLALTIFRSIYTKRTWRVNALCGASLMKYGNPAFNKTLRRVRVFRVPNSSLVFATGLWRPEIWVGENIRSAPQLKTALNHELAHIAANDQLILLLIVALERLLWWNPLIWLLGRQARLQMEYACDSRCQSLLGEAMYRQSLAELFLEQQPVPNSLELTLGNKSQTIIRLEKIGMKHFIKPNHLLTLALAGSLSAIATASFAGQRSSEQTTLMGCHKLLPDGVKYDFTIASEIDTREGQKGHLSVSLKDSLAPESREVPSGAGEFLQCIQKVVGVGDGKGWPES